MSIASALLGSASVLAFPIVMGISLGNEVHRVYNVRERCVFFMILAFIGMVGVIAGHLARKRPASQQRSELALLGVILGYMGAGFWLFGLVSTLLPR